MKKLRRLSRNNVFKRTPEIVENKTVILDETGEIITTWEIDKDEHTLLITFPETDTATVFGNIATHVEAHKDTLDYYGIDLHNTMFADITEQQTKRTALSLAEAVELTSALVSEIDDRKENSKTGNKIRVLIKDGDILFNIADPENPELYMNLLSNIQHVLENGAAVGITLLMEIDTDSAEEETHPNFTNAIILK